MAIVSGEFPNIYPNLNINVEGIPQLLRDEPAWVAWRYQARGAGKPAKAPISPRTGRHADITDTRQLVGFDDAIAFFRDRSLSGVGFAFRADDRFAGLDLDECRNAETGELDPLASDMLNELGTYAEVSPSGTGVKAFGIGRLDPNGPNRRGKVEIFDRERFFTLTGHKLPAAPPTIEPREDVLRRIQNSLRPESPASSPALLQCNEDATGFDGPDAELLTRAFASGNGEVIRRYWAGEMNGKSSPSEALLGLAQLLAFWTGRDEVRLSRLVTKSELFTATEAGRTKWDSRRKDSTWGMQFVIRKAIETCRSFYSPLPALPPAISPSHFADESSTQPCENSVHLFSTPAAKPNPIRVALVRADVRADAGELPPGLEGIPLPVTKTGKPTATALAAKRLAGVCWVMAGEREGGTFTLSLAAAGRAFGVGHTTVSRWLKVLAASKVITRVVWGNSRSGTASRWRWNGIERKDGVK